MSLTMRLRKIIILLYFVLKVLFINIITIVATHFSAGHVPSILKYDIQKVIKCYILQK